MFAGRFTNHDASIGPKMLCLEDHSVEKVTDKSNEEHDLSRTGNIISSLGTEKNSSTLTSTDISSPLTWALEASLNDCQPGGKRARTDFWKTVVDNNPYEGRRKDNYPVGLRNVGNTCWFSAVVQSLFHIPAFRKNILEFGNCQCDNAESDRKAMTVKELQKLFAFMMKSRRNFIDPSNVIECVTDFFKEDLNQQDVSEFLMKLIDYLEDTFKPKYERSPNDSLVNPVVDMFYGRYTVEGMNAGKPFTKEETFGAYPLQIDRFEDVCESIEGAMIHNNIETDKLGPENPNTQEHWFTRLPAVLILELSRFRFNQKSQLPEKIHSRMKFEENIYLDRFMLENRAKVRNLRKEIHRLKAEKILSGKAINLTATEGSPEPMEISDDDCSESRKEAKVIIDAMYEEDDLHKILYRLHSVLVHKGEANGGHYWAFIYDLQDKIWRKFNDITVIDVTWEEVYRESVGGSQDSSAYCLIYIDSKRAAELYKDINWTAYNDRLRNLVDEDNRLFEKELEDWDKKEFTTDTNNVQMANGTGDLTMETEETPAQVVEEQSREKNHRIKDASKILKDVTNMVSDAINRHDVGALLREWCKKKKEELMKRAAESGSLSENYESDVRLEHNAVYIIKCQAPGHVTDKAILETFLQETGGKAEKEDTHSICQEAKRLLKREYRVGELKEYEEWKEYYLSFQKANLAFIDGLEYLLSDNSFSKIFWKENVMDGVVRIEYVNRLDHRFDVKAPLLFRECYRYQESALYLAYVVKLNSQLPSNGQVNSDLLSCAIGYCLQKLNEEALNMFITGSDEDACKALDVMTHAVIPLMNIPDSVHVVERIRKQWFTLCLEKSPGKLQELMQDFLDSLCEGHVLSKSSEPPLLDCQLDCKTLSRKFSKIIRRINDSPKFLELLKFK